jgi:radical SAM protein with 4Fe4S-binding SPASM domain
MLSKTIKKLVNTLRSKDVKFSLNLLALEISNRFELSRVYGQPKHAQIEITTHCNFHCPMCSRTVWDNHNFLKNPKHMSLQDFKKIVLKLPYCESINLQGAGESLLNPDLVNMVRFCKKNNIRTYLITNASVLSEQLSRNLILSGLSEIYFSLDSADAKSFRKIRVGAEFSKVIHNIKRFVKLKSQLNSKTPFIGVRVSVFKENIYEIPRILELVNHLGIRHVTLKNMIKTSTWPTPINVLSKKQRYLLKKFQDYGRDLGMHVYIAFPPLITGSKKKRVKCWKAWKSVYITVNGGVLPCCLFPTGRRKVYGNILQQDFKEIWNNAVYTSLRESLKNKNLYHMCEICAWTR